MRKAFPEAGPLVCTWVPVMILTAVQLFLEQLSFSLYLLWAPHIVLIVVDAALAQSSNVVSSEMESSFMLALQLLITLLTKMQF